MKKPFKEEFPTVLERVYYEYKRAIHVSDIMSKSVIEIKPRATMFEVAKTMGKKHIGSLIVKEKEKAIGIVTERDLLSKILSLGKNPKDVKVREVMSINLITIKPIATIKEAAQMMIKEKGRLVVKEADEVVGIVTASDLVKTMPECPETMFKVDDIMTKNVMAVNPEETINSIIQLMGKQRIGSVIVTRNKKPYGIFTERDLLSNIIAKGVSVNSKVGDYVSSPLITIPTGTSVHKAAQTMASKHVRRLPILKGNNLVGIVTARDLVEAYSK